MDFEPDSIRLLISTGLGVVIGTGLGFAVCRALVNRRIQRAGADAWRTANIFYRTNYKLERKD